VVYLWDAGTGKELGRLEGHDGSVFALAFSADGKLLASGGGDRLVRLWDVASRKEVRRLEGHQGTVTSVAFAPDGKTLASATGWPLTDSSVRVWDVSTGQEVRRLPGDYLGSVAFAPDGKALAVAAGLALVRLYDPATGRELPQSAGRTLGAQCLAWSPDGGLVAAAGGDRVLLDPATGREVRRLGGAPENTYAAAFAPDGKTLATGGHGERLRLWDVAAAREARVLERPNADGRGGTWVTWIAFSPDGKLLAEADRDGSVSVWDATTGEQRRHFTAHDGPAWSVAFSPDGKTLVTGGTDHTVALWEVASAREVRRLTGHLAPVEGVAWSPDGRLVASGGRDGKVRLWNATTGQAVRVLTERDGWGARTNHHLDGKTLAFSPNGRLIAWGSWQAVDVWEVATGKERTRFAGHRGEVNSLTFSPDGRTLVTGSFDRSVIFWDVTGRRRDGRWATAELSPPELEAEWSALRGEDAARAHQAVWTLAADPKHALPLLKEQLRPVPAADEKQVARLIAALDDDDFDVREKATQELTKLPGAEPALRKALAGTPTAEVRQRAQHALEARQEAESSPEWVATLRALEVLEQLGTPEARQWLRALAEGEPNARLTQEAKFALRR
jgi:WD40 repeat protein